MRSSRSEVAARRAEVARLVGHGVSRVDQLARRLDVSVATIRRDLAALEARGAISRTYGGAKDPAHFTELHLRERMQRESSAKSAIGRTAAAMLPADGSVFLDAGSTCAAVVRHLPRDSRLTIVTRSLEIAILLADWPDVCAISTGGDVAPLSHGLVGHLTCRTLQHFRFDVAVLGVDAVDPVDGIGEPTLDEVATKEAAASRARDVVVVADHTKLEPSTVAAWTALNEWTLVTDADGPRAQEFRDHGVGVVIAGED